MTERAVFRLTAEGPELLEIAPGVSAVAKMGFRPSVDVSVKITDRSLIPAVRSVWLATSREPGSNLRRGLQTLP